MKLKKTTQNRVVLFFIQFKTKRSTKSIPISQIKRFATILIVSE